MQKVMSVVGMIGLVVLAIAMAIGFMYVSATNREATLRAGATAQETLISSSFDKMWKIIQEQTAVSSEERESFRETMAAIMESQQGIAGNGQLASFFTQAKVDVSPDLFKQLMSTIEAERTSFHRDQAKLIEIKKDHDTLLRTIPSKWFLGGIQELKIRIITSTRTQEAIQTGRDDKVIEFNKK